MDLLKKIAFCLILLVSRCHGFSQEISIRGGFNLSEMSIKWNEGTTYKNAKLMPGFHIGPIIDLQKNNHFAFVTDRIIILNKRIKRKTILTLLTKRPCSD